ncbi:hypothetical protein A3H26_00030 [candidate division WWE3 bacterium RIFCSPLOWO2_12_FULL_36_10]|uniref:TGS domain-containing protein n=1 Tax=candidate division WWE3 bacterium RIFCSPLOWO2_12_FULL_36_10 TaxID=1802630 RepID=A0A1F4VJD9_UNCKA|nr:MAG: hypothetical protein A3H26_00030 [candidate division WWE3 bacterium RIFCSPLOWO2_12_FULL_36_10]
MNKIEQAKKLARQIHKGQFRLNGESYYNHVERVFNKLYNAGVRDETVLISALLHNSLQYSDSPKSQIQKQFGPEVLFIIEQYKKLTEKTIKRNSPKNFNEKYIIQTFLNLAKDIRVLLIRLADRADNIESAFIFPLERRERAAERALYVYSPICRLMGGLNFTRTLEDEAFKILHPQQYFQIKKLIDKKKEKINKLFAESEEVLREILDERNINAKINHRIKHAYGIYRKSLLYISKGINPGKNFENILDVAAMRFVVNTVEECYIVEDILKQLWNEVSDSRDDYIRSPKPSGYQSLHNAFKVDRQLVIEVQIRTHEMHEISEFGKASHMFYKQRFYKMGDNIKEKFLDNISILKEINYWNIENKSASKEFEFTQFDKFVYVFTPKGDIIELPKGATVLDFAYSIHEDLGHSCSGCLINEKIAKLETQLKDGDLVEIRVSKNKKVPSPDWLDIAQTKRAKHFIKRALIKVSPSSTLQR